MSTGLSCRVSDFLWLVTESTLLPPEQIFTQIEKNISKSFRRNLRELSNNAMSLQLSPRNIFWLVTESTLLPLEHIITQNWRKRFFFKIFSSKFNKCFMKMFRRYHYNCLQEIWPQKIARWKSNFEIIFKLFLIVHWTIFLQIVERLSLWSSLCQWFIMIAVKLQMTAKLL